MRIKVPNDAVKEYVMNLDNIFYVLKEYGKDYDIIPEIATLAHFAVPLRQKLEKMEKRRLKHKKGKHNEVRGRR